MLDGTAVFTTYSGDQDGGDNTILINDKKLMHLEIIVSCL